MKNYKLEYYKVIVHLRKFGYNAILCTESLKNATILFKDKFGNVLKCVFNFLVDYKKRLLYNFSIFIDN